MKKIMANTKTAIILLILSALLLAVNIYRIARPISYGMDYHVQMVYEDTEFEGTMVFYSDNTMTNQNTNFDEAQNSRYYYKDGYIFFTSANTDEEYAAETDAINENFADAVNTPFYADEINAFRLLAAEMEDFALVYSCTTAIVSAIVGGVLELVLIGFTSASFIACNKRKREDV